jgi:hypothetical protein
MMEVAQVSPSMTMEELILFQTQALKLSWIKRENKENVYIACIGEYYQFYAQDDTVRVIMGKGLESNGYEIWEGNIDGIMQAIHDAVNNAKYQERLRHTLVLL